MSPIADPRFGAELRRLRTEARISLRVLAQVVYQSKSQLHDLEVGRRRPSEDMARRLDDALHADGRLVALACPPELPEDGAHRIAFAARHPTRTDPATVDALADLLASQRRLDDVLGAAAVMPAVRANLDLVSHLAREAHDDLRGRLVDQAAQWAQFAGWLGIAAGDHNWSRYWLNQALEWTVESGQDALLGTVLSFRAYLAGQVGDTGTLLGMTRAALTKPGMSPGQFAYDHYQLARACVLADDRQAAIDTAAAADERAIAALEHRGEMPPWDYYRDRAFFDLEAGTTRAALGQHEQAVALLTAGLDGLDAESASADWTGTYVCHLAGAQLAVGKRDSAARSVERARSIAARNRSGRLSALVRHLSASVDN
ncbi:helix-turn-helix domain-containing protein [Micromonospora sp. NPDC018662]|uniref:helix-turn-helix domain-containing protein n=1 Tax=Micromonospora sp. NPDC018662 TaxID=3364238 RepID=UPI00379397CC